MTPKIIVVFQGADGVLHSASCLLPELATRPDYSGMMMVHFGDGRPRLLDLGILDRRKLNRDPPLDKENDKRAL